MNLWSKIAAGIAVSSLAVAPVAAQATERASAPSTEASELNGTAWFGIIAAITVVILAVIAAGKDNNNSVSS